MIFFPTSNDDVSHFLRSRSKTSLHISGNDAAGETDIISLAKLNSVLFYEPEEMIISVQSGISLADLEKTLTEKNQWIPTLRASESSERTLGAQVAADHFHPRSMTCGALRTAILGGTFCTTSGEIFKSGSRVVKSVAGYDIHRAFCGSQGLFGIILDLTLKVQPLPETFFRFLAPIDARERLLQFQPTCLEETSDKLLVELAGYNEDLAHDKERLRSLEIPIEEIDEKTWDSMLKELMKIRERSRNISPTDASVRLLQKVRKVFDPEEILV